MIVIRGNYYDGKTSAQVPAECRVFDNGVVHVRGPDSPGLLSCRASQASPRLSSTRYIYFRTARSLKPRTTTVDDLLKRKSSRACTSSMFWRAASVTS
jgi:hypothetical protein